MIDRLSERKIVVVRRRSRLDDLIARFNSTAQARFYVEHLGADFSDFELEHEEYVEAIARAQAAVSLMGRVHVLERRYLPNFIFGQDDVVVAIGQDGIVANTLKYLAGQPLLGVNPSPSRWDGVLLPFLVKDLETVIPEVLRGGRPHKEVTMARARLTDGQTLLAVNDFFIGQKTHVSARYQLTVADKTERQSSSGIIVSTGLGSTGWFKSVLAGAQAVATSLAGALPPDAGAETGTFPWDADYLYFSVREPFPSRATGSGLVFGRVTGDDPLNVVSQMSENGVIFSDGIESDFLEFNSGMAATVSLAEKKGVLVV